MNDFARLFASNPALFAGCVFLLGLVVGSFLNVVIHRLPIMLERDWRAQAAEFLPTVAAGSADGSGFTEPFNLSVPRSACPSCKAPIKIWQNVPVLSWLALRGRCATCRTRISARYPLVELATASLSAWAAWHFGFGATAGCAVGVTWCLIALTGIDFDHQLLPDDMTLPLIWTGLLASVIVGESARSIPVAPQDAIIGAIAGYSSLWLVFQAFRLLTGKEGMGFGDFKLFAALGAWLGWKMLPLIILMSAGAGAILGILMIITRGRDRATPMPFGPYLAIAGWVAMLYGQSLVTGYLRISGLRQ